MALRIIEPGVYSLLVDGGRPNQRAVGVAIGGACDQAALAFGNALLGNPPDAVALEITLHGPTLEVTGEHAIVVWGADFAVQLNGRAAAANKTMNVKAGDQLSIGSPGAGLRGYVCVAGGFSNQTILGSRSAVAPVEAGEGLECSSSRIRARSVRLDEEFRQHNRAPSVLRVLPGVHARQFAADALVSARFTVSPQSDRMGLRLLGSPLPRSERGEMVSAPVCPGTVQVPPDGLPIILGRDAQTIGGYPRIAHVIEADWDRLGQLRPGQSVEWACVDWATAVKLRRERLEWIRRWVTRLRSSLF